MDTTGKKICTSQACRILSVCYGHVPAQEAYAPSAIHGSIPRAVGEVLCPAI